MQGITNANGVALGSGLRFGTGFSARRCACFRGTTVVARNGTRRRAVQRATPGRHKYLSLSVRAAQTYVQCASSVDIADD